MITVIRRYFKSGSQLVLWIVMAAFIIGLMPAAFRQMTQSGQWAIRVNGQDIGYRDFVHETNKQNQQIMAFRKQYGEYAEWLLSTMGMSDPRSMAYRAMVRQELMNQFGDQLGIHLNPMYVTNQMNDPQFVQDELSGILPPQIVDTLGGINHQMLRQYLHYTGLSSEMFERQIERALMDKVVRDLVQSSLYVPEFDIKQKYRTEHAKKNFSILSVSKDRAQKLVAQEPPTDQELEQFFDEQNKQLKRYWVPEKRSGTIWTFEPKNYHIEISNDELERYYEKNKVKEFIEQPATVQVRRILFKVPTEADRASVQDKIGRLRDEILPAPSQFAEFAKKHSEDEKTASNGGLMEPFERGTQEHIFDKTAFLMKNDGDISSVIETRDGYEMLQRVSKKPQVVKSFSTAKQEIRDKLTAKKFASLFEQDMKKIAENYSDQDESALKAFIKDKGGVPKQVIDQVVDNTPLMERLFKLELDQIAFYVDDSNGVAVQLAGVQERYLPSFESIKEMVKKDYYEQKAQGVVKNRIQKAKDALAENKSFESLQETFEGTMIQTGWLEPANPEEASSLQDKGIPVGKMLQLEKSGSIITHFSDEHGYLIRLDEIAELDEAKYKQERAELADSFINERTQQFMEGFVASLHRNAKIETNELLVTLQD